MARDQPKDGTEDDDEELKTQEEPETKDQESPYTCVDADNNAEVEEKEAEAAPGSDNEQATVILDREARRRIRRANAERRRAHERKTRIETMRNELESLQREYDKLFANAKGMIATSADLAMLTTLSDVAKEIHRLKQENEYFHFLISQKRQLWNSVQLITHELEERCSLQPVPRVLGSSTRRFRGDPSGFSFAPYSVEECFRICQMSFEESQRRFGECLMSYNARGTDTMGWRGFNVAEGDSFLRFHDHKECRGSPESLIKRTWDFLKDPQHYQRCFKNPLFLHLVQKVNDNMFIFRRATENILDGTINHALYLIYRLRTDRNRYMIGLVTLPLWGNTNSTDMNDSFGRRMLIQDEETMLSIHYWIAYETRRDPVTGQFRNVVDRWGSLGFDAANDAAFWRQESLDTALRFEFLLLNPFIQHLEF